MMSFCLSLCLTLLDLLLKKFQGKLKLPKGMFSEGGGKGDIRAREIIVPHPRFFFNLFCRFFIFLCHTPLTEKINTHTHTHKQNLLTEKSYFYTQKMPTKQAPYTHTHI